MLTDYESKLADVAVPPGLVVPPVCRHLFWVDGGSADMRCERPVGHDGAHWAAGSGWAVRWIDGADPDHVDVDQGDPPGVCRLCGCTDARACPGGCWWYEPGLCTAHPDEVLLAARQAVSR